MAGADKVTHEGSKGTISPTHKLEKFVITDKEFGDMMKGNQFTVDGQTEAMSTNVLDSSLHGASIPKHAKLVNYDYYNSKGEVQHGHAYAA
jgi:hypothetical protein